MKIRNNHPLKKESEIFCPHCHSTVVWKHGTYDRKWFHALFERGSSIRVVQRYRCCEIPCPCKTFTIQAEEILPYCRFRIPDLCALHPYFESAESLHSLSRTLDLSRPVLKRLRTLLQHTTMFLTGLCREISDGQTIMVTLRQGLQIARSAYCCVGLKLMWFRYRYRHRQPIDDTPHKIYSLP